ncbi:MAG: hypothetical protein ACREJC_04365 [Tepidisphaeraceae bacterium]
MKANAAGLLMGLGVLISNLGCQEMKHMTGPSIAGTYVLEYRIQADGKRVDPPNAGGLMTFTDKYRNFNVYWTENGKLYNVSCIARYWFDGKTYTEETTWFTSNLPGTSGVVYQTASEKGTSAVTEQDGKYSWKLPLHQEPEVVVSRHEMLATRSGPNGWVDHWKRVE